MGSAESRFSEIGSDSDAGDLESGELHSGHVKEEKQKKRKCRICHMRLVGSGGGGGGGRSGGGDVESAGGGGEWIELGCSCKGDLGAAHKQCAETWFKIRGNT